MDEAKGMQGFNYTPGEMARAGYAKGGVVKGPGTATSDSIPARLSNGEVVLNAGAAEAFKEMLGEQTVDQFNAAYAPEEAETEFKGGVLKAAGALPLATTPSFLRLCRGPK